MYNGYKNYETWAAGMWVDGNYDGQGLYLYWQEMKAGIWAETEADEIFSREERARYDLSLMIRDFVEEMDEGKVTGLLSDLLSAAIRSIEWMEVADCVIGDGWPEDDEEDS